MKKKEKNKIFSKVEKTNSRYDFSIYNIFNYEVEFEMLNIIFISKYNAYNMLAYLTRRKEIEKFLTFTII